MSPIVVTSNDNSLFGHNLYFDRFPNSAFVSLVTTIVSPSFAALNAIPGSIKKLLSCAMYFIFPLSILHS